MGGGRFLRGLPAAAALALAGASAQAQPEHRAIVGERFQADLRRIVGDFDGVAGVHALDLSSGERWGVNDELVFPQASAIKVPVLLELFRRAGEEPGLLRRRVTLDAAARAGGSGVLGPLTDGGSALSLEDLAVLMITHSDNTATNALIDVLGMEAVNALSASLGAPGTRLARRMVRPGLSARGVENVSTPREAARIMERIAACALPMDEAACRRVREILTLYKGGPLRAPVPREVPVAFKPGALPGVAAAWAIVDAPGRPYVLAVMASYGGDAAAVVAAVSARAYNHFSRLAGITPYGTRVPLEHARRAETESAAALGPPPEGGMD